MHVCKLKKSLYGLKQSARCWNSTLDSFLKSSGYKQVGADSCLYMKSVKLQNGKINFVILSIHVDDILWFSNDVIMLEEEKVAIGTKFKVEDLGEVSHMLGMLIKRDRDSRTLTISQSKYLEGVLKRFNMEECKPVSTPLEPGKQFHELSDN
ncbi:Retrovirus-related Pol poly from transposon TNT 1-94 [Paramuricea clavata]|uniref:Retrovirus-related Pol poly from transposon TNT 1-94 n=1 Tax=Paramuricea clavata TaxID=317549 RepID=A0A6S7JH29_PARCT|nr:Retrovirus-related Pol poly from transposon TNT 1-94 [Paramuricea clavata]